MEPYPLASQGANARRLVYRLYHRACESSSAIRRRTRTPVPSLCRPYYVVGGRLGNWPTHGRTIRFHGLSLRAAIIESHVRVCPPGNVPVVAPKSKTASQLMLPIVKAPLPYIRKLSISPASTRPESASNVCSRCCSCWTSRSCRPGDSPRLTQTGNVISPEPQSSSSQLFGQFGLSDLPRRRHTGSSSPDQ
jgi:hypothetical protein